VNMWDNRAQAWALIAAGAGRHFVRMFRAMKSFLELQDIRRIEATVDARFEQGHRMMRMLGFEYEGLMRAYLPDGRDCALYGRVR
jgi:RimJ/RimL family protein N-acetyltransferase